MTIKSLSCRSITELRHRHQLTYFLSRVVPVLAIACALTFATATQRAGRHTQGPPALSRPAQPVIAFPLPAMTQAKETSQPRPAKSAAELAKRIEALTGFIAKKYRLSRDGARELIGTAFTQGRRVGIDPLLIIAVMAVESSFNPLAESVAGAKGLMQVIPRFHPDKFADGDAQSVLDPETNIHAGTRILKEYIHRAGGLEAGLQLYNGAVNDESNAYAIKVLGEKERLQRVIGRVRGEA